MNPTVPDGQILGRRHLTPGRVEVVYRQRNGEVRVGRIFRTDAPEGDLQTLLDALRSIRTDSVLLPDRLEDVGGSSYLLSLGFEGMKPFGGPARSFRELLAPLLALHAAGWHHLDLSPHGFAEVRGELRLLAWGDILVPGAPGESPESAVSAPPDPLADIRALARAAQRSRGVLWDGDQPAAVDDLAAGSRAKLLTALGALLDAEPPYPHLPSSASRLPGFGRCTAIRGGSWEARDALVSSWTREMLETGAVIRCIRCRADQPGRPLPDRFPAGACRIDSVGALLERLFPAMGDVRRMLVVNDAEYASPDLTALLTELARYVPGDLALVLAAGALPADFPPEREIVLPGEVTLAEDRRLADIAPCHPGGAPFTSDGGFGYRLPAGIRPSAGGEGDPASLLAEGAYRFLVDLYGRSPSESLRRTAAESLLRLGMHREALELAGSGETLLRARAMLALGDPAGAAGELRGSGEVGEAGTLLLAEAMADGGDLEGSAGILSGLSGTDPALLLARVLDLQGRASEGLPAIRAARRTADRAGLVPLLCSESNILMRTGNYPEALAAAETAVRTASTLGDPGLLAMGLRERGRVREILGFWRDALGDYRLSGSCAGPDASGAESPSMVDRYVLELRMGDLLSARMTHEALRTGRLERTPAGRQMLEMLGAYRGVLLGTGGIGLPAARRAVALAAEQGLVLRHALSLLYLGLIEGASGTRDRALEALNGARARAGLLGDRHLILLSDLALAGTGALAEVDRLVAEAEELGLRMESLEARILAAGGGPDTDGAFAELLDLPAPLKALELARILRERGPGTTIRERIGKTLRTLAEMLDGEERAEFEETHRLLAAEPRPAAAEPLPANVERGIGTVTSWVRDLPGNGTGSPLEDLARELGLDSLSSSPTGVPGEERVSESPDLYAAGPDLGPVRLLGPLVALLKGLEPAPAREDPRCVDPFPEIIGRSAAMSVLKGRMEKSAPMSMPVLVIGETGTGKELVARGLHRTGSHPEGPFIAVDCGAIAPNLLESELFGAAKGAYTDSRTDRRGLMESAEGGTLFLDEIGNLTPALQVRLLRVLETGTLRRLGDPRERQVGFRLVCATQSEPTEGSGAGALRPDLYYRIAVIVLRLPPLRERIEDIPLLAEHFARTMLPQGHPALSRGAVRRLAGYGWPGNIRELRNVVQRAIIFRSGEGISREDIVFGEGGQAPEGDGLSIPDCVAAHVRSVLDRVGGSVPRAAGLLGCDPKTVRKYVRRDKGGAG